MTSGVWAVRGVVGRVGVASAAMAAIARAVMGVGRQATDGTVRGEMGLAWGTSVCSVGGCAVMVARLLRGGGGWGFSMVAESGRDKAWTAALRRILDIVSHNP